MTFETQAELIRERRRELGFSQKKLADAIGYSSSQFISNMERGVAGIPEKDLVKFSKRLKLDRRKLLMAVLDDHALRLEKVLGVNL